MKSLFRAVHMSYLWLQKFPLIILWGYSSIVYILGMTNILFLLISFTLYNLGSHFVMLQMIGKLKTVLHIKDKDESNDRNTRDNDAKPEEERRQIEEVSKPRRSRPSSRSSFEVIPKIAEEVVDSNGSVIVTA